MMDTLPKGWTIAKLEEVCEMYQPHTISTKQLKSDGKYWVYGANGIIGKYDKYNHEHSELLVTCRGASCGSVNISRPYSWINGNAMVVRPIDANLLILNFIEMFFRGGFNVKNAISGSAQPQITRTSLNPLEIPIPPLNEQKRILAKLEQLLTDLDKGIEYLETTKQQLKVYRQAVLKWAFEGKLTNKNVKDGELPKGWKWEKINELLIHPKKGMTTGPFGTALKKHEHTNSGVPVLGIENIGEGKFVMPNKIFVTPQKAEALNSFRVIENDIIISRSGTVGEICVVPKQMQESVISTNIIRVRLNQEIISPKLFVYMFQGGTVKEKVKELCKGSTRAFLNQTILNQLDFPYCSTFEQNKILQEIESRLSVCDKIEETIESSLQQAEALRLSIIKKAFEGKLVPQDPNDEPAEKLLERIRSLRQAQGKQGNGKSAKKEKVKTPNKKAQIS